MNTFQLRYLKITYQPIPFSVQNIIESISSMLLAIDCKNLLEFGHKGNVYDIKPYELYRSVKKRRKTKAV